MKKVFYLAAAILTSLSAAVWADNDTSHYFQVVKTPTDTCRFLVNDIKNIHFDVFANELPIPKKQNVGDGIEYEYVDLGLPSGTLWATANLGASSPEELGGYFSWGEIEPGNYFSQDTYEPDIDLLPENISATEYDAAFIQTAYSGVMPDKDQIKELVDECSWEWAVESGVDGYRVTGKNGASIFFPVSGFYREENWMDKEVQVAIWSSIRFSSDRAFVLDAFHVLGDNFQYPVELIYEGRQIRAVKYDGEPYEEPSYAMITEVGGMKVEIYNSVIKDCHVEQVSTSPDMSNANAVDLGLPSGTLWADRNLGAETPEDCGSYIDWGSVNEDSFCSETTYPYYHAGSKKYDTLGYSIAGTKYDAATSNWGGSWVTPTLEDVYELMEYTESELIDGGKAIRLTGGNGNSIVIPFAGLKNNGTVMLSGEFGYYHTATSDQKLPWVAYGMYADSAGVDIIQGSKWVGQTIRPVWK